MIIDRRQQRFAIAAALIGPSALVMAFRLIGGISPASASAASELVELTPGTYVLGAQPVSASEQAVSDWLDAQPQLGFHESPMRMPEPKEINELVVEAPVAEIGMRLTSIMGGERPIAMINGRAHRLHDVLARGWQISEIGRRWVILTRPDGRTRRLDLDRRSP